VIHAQDLLQLRHIANRTTASNPAIMLIGNLGRDPELRQAGDRAVAETAMTPTTHKVFFICTSHSFGYFAVGSDPAACCIRGMQGRVKLLSAFFQGARRAGPN
jgi:hypothetical protein